MPDLINENKVIVNIFGEEYPIIGDNDPDYINGVAKYVDTKMKEVASISPSKARDKLAILTALSIASELKEKNDILDRMEKQKGNLLDNLLSRLDKALGAPFEID
ncbi:MAG: cell division protein ZapA [candidate division Zixibacteria bacterium]|nr:cell division protein ZapA [candidate division Zixibacteria bacterium]MDD5425906.1 cell division protein ZapA [candidate division Zixibacteria bacterium]